MSPVERSKMPGRVNYTIVNTSGVVLHQGSGGVRIVTDPAHQMPWLDGAEADEPTVLMDIGEESDDESIDIFIDVISGKLITVEDDEPVSTHEICCNRSDVENVLFAP